MGRRGTRLEEVGRLSEWHVIHPHAVPPSLARYLRIPYISSTSSSSYVRMRRTAKWKRDSQEGWRWRRWNWREREGGRPPFYIILTCRLRLSDLQPLPSSSLVRPRQTQSDGGREEERTPPKSRSFPSLSSSACLQPHTLLLFPLSRDCTYTHSTFRTVKGPKSNVELFIFMRQTHLTSRNKTENPALTPYACSSLAIRPLCKEWPPFSPPPPLYIPGMPSGAPFPSSPPSPPLLQRQERERKKGRCIGGVFPAGGERRDGYYGWSPPSTLSLLASYIQVRDSPSGTL